MATLQIGVGVSLAGLWAEARAALLAIDTLSDGDLRRAETLFYANLAEGGDWLRMIFEHDRLTGKLEPAFLQAFAARTMVSLGRRKLQAVRVTGGDVTNA